MATVGSSVPALLSMLTESLTSATSSLPTDHDLLKNPPNGISLLDTKNALLLSYIQNLVFLVIVKLRHTSPPDQNGDTDLTAAAVRKLVELRLYLERGIRPLEGRLKYQIEKVLRAADDADRAAATKTHTSFDKNSTTKVSGAEDDASDVSATHSVASPPPAKPSDLSYRPNPAALLRKQESSSNAKSSTTRTTAAYKPPRITPTSMPKPTASSHHDGRRQRKSYLLDEYVSSELSSAPLAQPSIGSNSTILDRGRGSLNARQRETERERTEYEERNFARLPGESKAEKRKARARGDGAARNVYGGEQWVELGEAGDRVARSVGRNRDREGGRGVLERREKRRRENGDEGGGSLGIGDMFEKRRRVMEGRAEKKAKKGR